MSAVVHEAFVQRQHTRYRLPMQVTFHGNTFAAADWSVGGVGLVGLDLDIGVGTVHPLRLAFSFAGFSLAVEVDGEIRYVDRQRRRVGFRFVDPTMQQLSLLQFVIDAHLAGEIVDGGEMLEVTTREAGASPRKTAAAVAVPAAERWRRLASTGLSYAIVATIFAGIVGLVGSNFYDRLFIVHPVAASITADVTVLAPEVAGRVGGLRAGGEIVAGETAFEITTGDGAAVAVASPCDCRILSAEVSEGAVVRAGQTVLTLVPPGAEPVVTAALDYADLGRLSPDSVAHIQYLDGSETTVRGIRFQPSMMARGGALADAHALVRLDPGRPLDAATIGQPVNVWFDTSGLPTAGSPTDAEPSR